MSKARKGDCGTCHWFEMEGDGHVCLVNPPVISQTMIPAGMGPQGPMMKPALQGLCPPTRENRRCEKWRPAGRLPDIAFDKVN